MILRAIDDAGLKPGRDAALALDVAATHFYSEGIYEGQSLYYLRAGGEQSLDSDEMVALLARWVDTYPILSIEDGLAEDDWDGWRALDAVRWASACSSSATICSSRIRSGCGAASPRASPTACW